MEIQAITPEVIEDAVFAAGHAQSVAPRDIAATFGSSHIDLLSKPLGSRILAVSDEWFAAAENLTTPTPPVSKPGVFTYAGAWYDGWETRRHNPKAFDYVVFRLGVASGTVRGVEINTGFFNGNHAPEVSVEGCFATNDDDVSKEDFKGWKPILEKQECRGAYRNAWLLNNPPKDAFTHVRLLMYPDGGIGRFRLYGDAVPVFPADVSQTFDLAASINGGVATRCSDQHFGTKDNLILPGRGQDMGDGWETKRSRGVHVDWTIIRLGATGHVDKLVVDTAHFRGNFPQKVQVYAAEGPEEPKEDEHERWIEILPPQPCGPDKEHEYDAATLRNADRSYRFVKLVIIPDGGVKRLRVYGRRAI